MLEFGDSVYYIDIKAFDKVITLQDVNKSKIISETETKTLYDGANSLISTEVITRNVPQNKEIDAAKYDLLKTFIEYIIDYSDETDDTLGSDRALSQTSLGYKIVFNTLLQQGIIKEKEQ